MDIQQTSSSVIDYYNQVKQNVGGGYKLNDVLNTMDKAYVDSTNQQQQTLEYVNNQANNQSYAPSQTDSYMSTLNGVLGSNNPVLNQLVYNAGADASSRGFGRSTVASGIANKTMLDGAERLAASELASQQYNKTNEQTANTELFRTKSQLMNTALAGQNQINTYTANNKQQAALKQMDNQQANISTLMSSIDAARRDNTYTANQIYQNVGQLESDRLTKLAEIDASNLPVAAKQAAKDNVNNAVNSSINMFTYAYNGAANFMDNFYKASSTNPINSPYNTNSNAVPPNNTNSSVSSNLPSTITIGKTNYDMSKFSQSEIAHVNDAVTNLTQFYNDKANWVTSYSTGRYGPEGNVDMIYKLFTRQQIDLNNPKVVKAFVTFNKAGGLGTNKMDNLTTLRTTLQGLVPR